MTYYVPLCNYANNLVSDDSTAEDIVQDVFLNLWKNNNAYSVETNIQGFLFKAVRNKAFELMRSQKSYDAALKRLESDTTQNDREPDAEPDRYMQMEQINKLLRHLPPKCRKVFALHKLNGLTYAEIAADQEISERTVQNHMIKALRILRSEYSTNK